MQNPQLSYNSAAIISTLKITGNVMWYSFVQIEKHQIISLALSDEILSLLSVCFHAIHPDEMVLLLRPHYITMLEYLLVFLKKKDVKLQHLCIVTVLNLKKGLHFLHCSHCSHFNYLRCPRVNSKYYVIASQDLLSVLCAVFLCRRRLFVSVGWQ